MINAARSRRGRRAVRVPPALVAVDQLGIRPLAIAWGIVAIVAAIPRLALIDRAPLGGGEAARAFGVWLSVLGTPDSSLGEAGSPLLGHLTALIFYLFGASDTAARVVPALAGIAL